VPAPTAPRPHRRRLRPRARRPPAVFEAESDRFRRRVL